MIYALLLGLGFVYCRCKKMDLYPFDFMNINGMILFSFFSTIIYLFISLSPPFYNCQSPTNNLLTNLKMMATRVWCLLQ
jgi:hypothetical protein